MQNRTVDFFFGNFDFNRDNVFLNNQNSAQAALPLIGNFLLLDGTSFLLLDGTNFLLL